VDEPHRVHAVLATALGNHPLAQFLGTLPRSRPAVQVSQCQQPQLPAAIATVSRLHCRCIRLHPKPLQIARNVTPTVTHGSAAYRNHLERLDISAAHT
jgi:hypothetical protein